MSNKSREIQQYITQVKESNKIFDTKMENIQLKNMIQKLELENIKLPKAKALLQEYKSVLEEQSIALEYKNKELEKLKNNIEELHKIIKQIPKIIRKIFVKEQWIINY